MEHHPSACLTSTWNSQTNRSTSPTRIKNPSIPCRCRVTLYHVFGLGLDMTRTVVPEGGHRLERRVTLPRNYSTTISSSLCQLGPELLSIERL
jgi:hypothetical protein